MTEVVGFFKSYDHEKFIIIDDEGEEIEMYFGVTEDEIINFEDPFIKYIVSFLNKRICFFYNNKKIIIKEVPSEFKQVFTKYGPNGRSGMSMDTFLNHVLNK